MSLWCCHTKLSEIADKLTSGNYSEQVVTEPKKFDFLVTKEIFHTVGPLDSEHWQLLPSQLPHLNGEKIVSSWGSSTPPKCCRTGWNKLRQWEATFHRGCDAEKNDLPFYSHFYQSVSLWEKVFLGSCAKWEVVITWLSHCVVLASKPGALLLRAWFHLKVVSVRCEWCNCHC